MALITWTRYRARFPAVWIRRSGPNGPGLRPSGRDTGGIRVLGVFAIAKPLAAFSFPQFNRSRYTADDSSPIPTPMSHVTDLLSAMDRGDPRAARDLFPVVYDELRQLAAAQLAREPAGHTLQPTALVHEAYLRLVDGDPQQQFNGRGHFFGAAAEAMRRILVDQARRKQAEKRGGGRARVDLDELVPAAGDRTDDLLALDDALAQLAEADADAAQLVKLRYFGGLTIKEAAAALGVSPRTADSVWAYARAWLLDRLDSSAS